MYTNRTHIKESQIIKINIFTPWSMHTTNEDPGTRLTLTLRWKWDLGRHNPKTGDLRHHDSGSPKYVREGKGRGHRQWRTGWSTHLSPRTTVKFPEINTITSFFVQHFGESRVLEVILELFIFTVDRQLTLQVDSLHEREGGPQTLKGFGRVDPYSTYI